MSSIDIGWPITVALYHVSLSLVNIYRKITWAFIVELVVCKLVSRPIAS